MNLALLCFSHREPSTFKVHMIVSSISVFDFLSIGLSEMEYSTRKSAKLGLVQFFEEKSQFDIYLSLMPIWNFF